MVVWHSHPGADHQHHGDALSEQVQGPGLQNLRDYSVVSEVQDLSDIGRHFTPHISDCLSCCQLKNPHWLECSTEWSLNPRVTSLLFSIGGYL